MFVPFEKIASDMLTHDCYVLLLSGTVGVDWPL
jgi:hypothetical protein